MEDERGYPQRGIQEESQFVNLEDTSLKNEHSFTGPKLAPLLVNRGIGGRTCRPTVGQDAKYLEEPTVDGRCSSYTSMANGCCVADEAFLRNLFVIGLYVTVARLPPVFQDVARWFDQNGQSRNAVDMSALNLITGEPRSETIFKLYMSFGELAFLPVFERVSPTSTSRTVRYVTGEWRIDENSEWITRLLKEDGTALKVHQTVSTPKTVQPYPWRRHFYSEVPANSPDDFGINIGELPGVISDPRFGHNGHATHTCHHNGFFENSKTFPEAVIDILSALSQSTASHITIQFRVPPGHSREFSGYTKMPDIHNLNLRGEMEDAVDAWVRDDWTVTWRGDDTRVTVVIPIDLDGEHVYFYMSISGPWFGVGKSRVSPDIVQG